MTKFLQSLQFQSNMTSTYRLLVIDTCSKTCASLLPVYMSLVLQRFSLQCLGGGAAVSLCTPAGYANEHTEF